MEGPPLKKQKKGTKEPYMDPLKEFWGRKQILSYPRYDDTKEPETGLDQSGGAEERNLGDVGDFSAGNQMAPGHVSKATTSVYKASVAAGASSDKMEDPFLFGDNEHQISDNSDDDLRYEGERFGWDNTNLASLAFFQVEADNCGVGTSD